MRYTIGRDRECDIPIADDSVSRLHAEITFAGGGKILLRDCGSSNGTTLLRESAKKLVGEEQVFPADNVRFGGVTLSVKDMLDAINARNPVPPPPPPSPQQQNDSKLVRCICGAIKRSDEYCTSCGQGPSA